MKNLSLNLKNDDSELRCQEEEIDLSRKISEESSHAKMGPTNDSSDMSSPKNNSVELETNEKVEDIIINN